MVAFPGAAAATYQAVRGHAAASLTSANAGALHSLACQRACCKQLAWHAGSDSGTVCLWGAAAAEWRLAKALKGHAGAVHALCAHPAGAAALSVARDRQMRLWDLATGRCAYQAPLGGEGLAVEFLEGGSRYAVAVGAAVTLHSTQVCTHIAYLCCLHGVAAAAGIGPASARSAMDTCWRACHGPIHSCCGIYAKYVEWQSASAGTCTCADCMPDMRVGLASFNAHTQSTDCAQSSKDLRMCFQLAHVPLQASNVSALLAGRTHRRASAQPQGALLPPL